MKDLTGKLICVVSHEEPGIFYDYNICEGGGYTPNNSLVIEGCFVRAAGRGREVINMLGGQFQKLADETRKPVIELQEPISASGKKFMRRLGDEGVYSLERFGGERYYTRRFFPQTDQ